MQLSSAETSVLMCALSARRLFLSMSRDEKKKETVHGKTLVQWVTDTSLVQRHSRKKQLITWQLNNDKGDYNKIGRHLFLFEKFLQVIFVAIREVISRNGEFAHQSLRRRAISRQFPS